VTRQPFPNEALKQCSETILQLVRGVAKWAGVVVAVGRCNVVLLCYGRRLQQIVHGPIVQNAGMLYHNTLQQASESVSCGCM
jgi:hypothetical protein